MLTREQTAIFEALTNAEGTALTLKYPKSGEFLSAFVFFPESENRVMVFHERSGTSSDPTIWLTFLEKNTNWTVAHSLSFFATGIEQVEFSALGDCDGLNIIISTSITGQPDKNLYVIAFNEETHAPERVFGRDFCAFYQVGDFDNSGKNMLMSINMSSGDSAGEAVIWFSGWSEGWFATPHELLTESAGGDYVRTIMGVVSEPIPVIPEPDEADESDESEPVPEPEPPERFPALFIEFLLPNGEANTSIIAWNENGVPRNIMLNMPNRTLLRKFPNEFTTHAYSRDIDGSGTVNPAGNRRFPGYTNTFSQDVVWATIWYEVIIGGNGDGLEQLFCTYLSVNNDFVFFLPDDWDGNVTAVMNNEPSANVVNEVIFLEYDAEAFDSFADATAELLTIITVPSGRPLCRVYRRDWEEFIRFGADNRQYDYYVRIHNNSLTRSELREALQMLE
jgi:hypothetical protein